jgi:hypothetical protein
MKIRELEDRVRKLEESKKLEDSKTASARLLKIAKELSLIGLFVGAVIGLVVYLLTKGELDRATVAVAELNAKVQAQADELERLKKKTAEARQMADDLASVDPDKLRTMIKLSNDRDTILDIERINLKLKLVARLIQFESSSSNNLFPDILETLIHEQEDRLQIAQLFESARDSVHDYDKVPHLFGGPGPGDYWARRIQHIGVNSDSHTIAKLESDMLRYRSIETSLKGILDGATQARQHEPTTYYSDLAQLSQFE